MSDKVPEPTELIYSPGDSWAPALIAAGIAICSPAASAMVVGRDRRFSSARPALLVAPQRRRDLADAGASRRSAPPVIPAEPVRRPRA